MSRSCKKLVLAELVRRASRVAACTLILIGSAFAGSVGDYEKQIAAARGTVVELANVDPSMQQIAVYQRDKVQLLRKTLPPTESVDWPSGTIDVDNAWFATALDGYLAEVNLSKQSVILDRIDERLAAISARITEMQTAAASGHTKDEDKRKLAEILSRPEYQKPEVRDESLFQKWKRELLEWLSKMFPSVDIKPREPAAGMGSLALVLQVLLYAALAAAIIFLLYKFVPFLSRKFGKKDKTPNNERVILGERIAEDQSSADLFSDAERLARDGQLRLAIRKGYIALLCELSDRKAIGLARHKTNRDYLRDLRSRRELFNNVSGLTGSFERHWYGTDESAQSDWDEFRTLYNETVRGV
ncbi:MAG: DUF4129 domain-containing protein [Acidobacteriota bacterium]